MEHPFIGDLSDKTMDELHSKMNELTKNLTFAYRMGNYNVVSQLQMIVESYRAEINKRMTEMYKKQNIQDRINISKHDS